MFMHLKRSSLASELWPGSLLLDVIIQILPVMQSPTHISDHILSLLKINLLI